MPQGKIEVICGPMFSGKTEELIRRLRRATIAKLKVIVFKPSVDKRYAQNAIVSHNKNSWDSMAINSAKDILNLCENYDVIGIDEAQFFEDDVVEVVNECANSGRKVIVSGLDMDFLGRPFMPMPLIMAIAEEVTKLKAVCSDTGLDAHFSYRLDKKKPDTIMIGEKDSYTALSRNSFYTRINE